ncbi:MAG: 30S ribosomal protein S17 [Coriobacteriales bacterium]|nr:30S ribosomal protein S17 [Coriobacteriales bacterium]
MTEERNNRKVRQGVVASAAGDKTITVVISERKPHPVYKKMITRTKKFYAHDENNEAAEETAENPLHGTLEPENWNLVDIDDGTYYIAEYLGVIDNPNRSEEETETVKAFAEWFGSAETQIAWSEEFDSYPCNEDAAAELFDEVPAIYAIPNFSLNTVEGTDMTYAEYVGAHSAEWTNIMTNLGFYWADNADAPAEPDWDNLDWATLTQAAPEA